MKRTEPSLCQSITKKPGWGGSQAPGPSRLCVIMSLPARSWDVPQGQKLNMAEVKLKKKMMLLWSAINHTLKVLVWKRCYQLSLPQSKNSNPIPMSWRKLRLSKTYGKQFSFPKLKEKKKCNTCSLCQMATPTHNLILPF